MQKEAKIQIPKNDLENILKRAQRKAVVGGKITPLVSSCILQIHNNTGLLSITSLVKDGVSSISSFSTEVSSIYYKAHTSTIPVASIENLLGILKHHSKDVTLEYYLRPNVLGRIVVSSGKKTTKIISLAGALAYSSSPDTIGKWFDRSLEISKKIIINGTGYPSNIGIQKGWDALIPAKYLLANGEEKEAFAYFQDVDTTTLFEALRCDGMNSKKEGRYTFLVNGTEGKGDALDVVTGKSTYGQTTTRIRGLEKGNKDYVTPKNLKKCTFEGGLEEMMKLSSGNCGLSFFEFEERKNTAGQYGLVIDFGNANWVFLTSTPMEELR